MHPQYEVLAKCLLPEHMLEWFELTSVEIKPREKKSKQDEQIAEYSANVIHLYLDENDLTPDNGSTGPPMHQQNRSMQKSRTSGLS